MICMRSSPDAFPRKTDPGDQQFGPPVWPIVTSMVICDSCNARLHGNPDRRRVIVDAGVDAVALVKVRRRS